MMPAIQKKFHLIVDVKVELSTENEFLKKTCSHSENCSEESKSWLLKQFGYEKRANLIISRLQKQMKKKQ